jgi:hypothetical protein
MRCCFCTTPRLGSASLRLTGNGLVDDHHVVDRSLAVSLCPGRCDRFRVWGHGFQPKIWNLTTKNGCVELPSSNTCSICCPAGARSTIAGSLYSSTCDSSKVTQTDAINVDTVVRKNATDLGASGLGVRSHAASTSMQIAWKKHAAIAVIQ